MTAHNEESGSVVQLLHSDVGLTDSQVEERRAQYGENKLRERKKKTNLQRFVEQFKDAMILILIAAAMISFVIACVEGEPEGFFEPALILLIVILNAIMGVMQESKAEKALDALKSLSAPHARVIRDGKEKLIDAAEMVPGDIIHLEAGDFIPADAQLIHSVSLKSEESALTGESVPSEKDANVIVDEKVPLGDRCNMVFSGCSITYGTAAAVVTATGMDTEMGKIANLLDSEEEGQTPLQKKLAQLGKYLGALALAACAIIFVVGIANGITALEIFMIAVSLAVSAIPEGLPAIVTIVLSIGVQRMVKKNAIIRRLPAVETLGGASVICSDKTGTLTQNRMTLVQAYLDGVETPERISTQNSAEVKTLLSYGTLCSDGSVIFQGDEEQHIGDPTETAIVLAAHKNGMPKDMLNSAYPRLAEIPFDSDRKLMTTVNKIDKVPDESTSEELENGLTFMGLVGMIDPPRPEAKTAVGICRKAGIKPVMITGDHVVTASAIAKELGIMRGRDRAITGPELDA